MTGYLLDTNAISMFVPTKMIASEGFSDWLREQDRFDALYLSAVTIHEIEKGISLLKHKGATAKAAKIRQFLTGLVEGYGERILPVTGAVASVSGALEAKAIYAGFSPGAADALIAGTARFHDLTVITSNLQHFRAFDIAVLSPNELTG